MDAETANLRDMATDALRYWEPRRVVYNVVLALIVLAHFWLGASESRGALNLDTLLALFVLAVLANVAYCAAYVADLFLQWTHYRAQRRRWRAGIALVGFAFAAVLTHFFAASFFLHLPSID